MTYTDEVLKMYSKLLEEADKNNQEAIDLILKINESYKKTVTS